MLAQQILLIVTFAAFLFQTAGAGGATTITGPAQTEDQAPNVIARERLPKFK